MAQPIAERLSKLRALMRTHNLDYYFVPARDAHNDEYLPACWKRRGYITGFTGSAGDALIGLHDAYLWTDPRYTLQAQQQLDADYFSLMHQQQGSGPPIPAWLTQHAAGKRIGTDPRVMTSQEHAVWHKALQTVGGELISTEHNLIDAIWQDQPALHYKKIIVLEECYTGQSTHSKLTALRAELKTLGATALAINMLDAIAWLFNIRGSDIDYNPVAVSYALITQDDATLFIDAAHLTDEARQYFHQQKINIQPYDEFARALQHTTYPTLLEENSASWWMEQNLKNATVVFQSSPITLMKAIKNNTEQQGMRDAHRRDGLVLCHLFYWLEQNWRGETELSIANKVDALRAQDPLFRGLSFNTISSYAQHGAINHYAVDEQTNIPLSDQTLFLLDSGGQYLTGTTDVTRTVHLGTPSALHKQHYTLVLKGHLALRHTLFPHGICGEQLNAIAHQPLWSQGLDFGHGTGHGVGCYLCVHEGPQRISSAYTRVPLVPGMILSNEPGLYIENSYGIRIENLVLVTLKLTQQESPTGHGPFYTFEDLTLFPYARNLIDKTMLSPQEIDWINSYHELVYSKLQADLPETIQLWLRKATAPL